MPNIYQKINAVQKKVKYVQKDAQISGAGSYKAVTHDNIVSLIRKHLVEIGIVIYPEQLEGRLLQERNVREENGKMVGNKQHLYAANYNIHFVNIEDPNDRITSVVEAHANDTGDKAPGKALTYATKSAILKVFCLETGENEESRAASYDYTEAQYEIYHDLLREGSPMEFYEFLSSLPEELPGRLAGSFEKGDKVSGKKRVGEKLDEAYKILDDYAVQIREHLESQSDDGVKELVDELTPFEKRFVAARLSDDELDRVKTITKGE